MRACLDWPGGEGRVVEDAQAFLASECPERTEAMALLRQGQTFRDPFGRWTLTPIPERTP